MRRSLAPLDRADPFARVVDVKDDMIRAIRMPGTRTGLLSRATDIATPDRPCADDRNLEPVISPGTRVVVLDMGERLEAEERGLVGKLAEAGIAAASPGFRQGPTADAAVGIQPQGRILDPRDEADAVVGVCATQMALTHETTEHILAGKGPRLHRARHGS